MCGWDRVGNRRMGWRERGIRIMRVDQRVESATRNKCTQMRMSVERILLIMRGCCKAPYGDGAHAPMRISLPEVSFLPVLGSENRAVPCGVAFRWYRFCRLWDPKSRRTMRSSVPEGSFLPVVRFENRAVPCGVAFRRDRSCRFWDPKIAPYHAD